MKRMVIYLIPYSILVTFITVGLVFGLNENLLATITTIFVCSPIIFDCWDKKRKKNIV